jgi:hypothetical protein
MVSVLFNEVGNYTFNSCSRDILLGWGHISHIDLALLGRFNFAAKVGYSLRRLKTVFPAWLAGSR